MVCALVHVRRAKGGGRIIPAGAGQKGIPKPKNKILNNASEQEMSLLGTHLERGALTARNLKSGFLIFDDFYL